MRMVPSAYGRPLAAPGPRGRFGGEWAGRKGNAMTDLLTIPNGMPQLSRGRHRSAKTGACFMEFASYLAGEPWSDSPQCTDPLLSHLARAVNDLLPDSRRNEIAPDIPRV